MPGGPVRFLSHLDMSAALGFPFLMCATGRWPLRSLPIVGPDECDVQMLGGGSSVTDILLADSACKRDVEQWGQERGSLSQAAPSFPQRRFPRDSVRSDPPPISHSTLDLSLFQLCTYTCGYYFVLLSLPRYCELLVDKECPPGHSMSHSNSLPLGRQKAARDPDTF